MKRYCSLLFFVFVVLSAFAGECTVVGIAKGYEGQTLVLKTYADEIVFTEKELASAVVDDATGHVTFKFGLESATACFIESGVYHAILFAEPGKNYAVELPPYQPLTRAEEFNPYFSLTHILLTVKNAPSNDLNNQIAEFEQYADYYSAKAAFDEFSLDSIRTYINRTEKEFQAANQPFFQQYRQYNYALMIDLNEKTSPTLAITTYMSKLPVAYENTAFWEAFNIIFDDFLNAYGTGSEQELINKALKDNDYTLLSSFLEEQLGMTDKNLRELVVIKGLYDAYYSKSRNPLEMLALMKKWGAEISGQQNMAILKEVINRLDREKSSTRAFNFTLPDEKGKYHQLSDYTGKYVYINFCNTNIALSKKDFGILARYAESYKKDLYVINIFTDNHPESVNAFVAKQKDKQSVNLYWNNDRELTKNYYVVNIPTYFLVDRNGNMLLSPAPTPDEEFERTFEEILMKEKIKNPEQPAVEDMWWK